MQSIKMGEKWLLGIFSIFQNEIKGGTIMLKEIFIMIFELSGIVSLILVTIFWFFIWPKFTKKVDLLSNIIVNPKKETLRKELIEQCKETAKLNLEVCDEFKYVDGENLK